jgi:hypothetical protein
MNRDKAQALFDDLKAPSDMSDLVIIATHGLPDAAGNIDVGLLEPDDERTEITREHLNIHDRTRDPDQLDYSGEWILQGEIAVQVAVCVRVRATTPQERANWTAESDAAADLHIAKYGTSPEAAELRERLGIA